MLSFVVKTCSFHVCDMFDEMPIMASRGPVYSLSMFLQMYHCYLV